MTTNSEIGHLIIVGRSGTGKTASLASMLEKHNIYGATELMSSEGYEQPIESREWEEGNIENPIKHSGYIFMEDCAPLPNE